MPARPDWPFAPARAPFYYGWVILGAATLGTMMSIPGQTMGFAFFADHVMEATGLSRVQVAGAYFVGTVASGLLLLVGGALLDRIGARLTALAACGLLSATLVYLSLIDRTAELAAVAFGLGSTTSAALPLLALGFVALRFSGQGMLTLVSRTLIGRWFEQRRGLASGISSLFVAFAFGSAPWFLEIWIGASGWRGAWHQMALMVGGGMAVVTVLLYRDTPEACGLPLDGRAQSAGEFAREQDRSAAAPGDLAATRGEALRTLAFWAITIAMASQGMNITGVTFHIADLGVEAGVRENAGALFLPIAAVNVVTAYSVGLLCDRGVPVRWLLVNMMGFQMLGLLAMGGFGEPLWWWAAVIGLGVSGGSFAPLSTVAIPRFFGRLHLGKINSFMMMVVVIGSAFGPSVLAASRDGLGSYRPALWASCALPVAALLLALFMRDPPRMPQSAERARIPDSGA